MKNPIKQMGLMLAAALVMVAGTNCGGPKQASQTTTQRQQPPVRTAYDSPPAPQRAVSGGYSGFAPADNTPAATVAKTAAVDDELDVAIRDASDCLNDNIPKGSKIVILNIESSSANIAEYIIDELIANAINDKNFSVVDRRQLEAIQTEQKFQMSGAVADKDALRIGQFFGAQTIVSGAMREMGGRYRMTVRALAVETAVVQSQCNQNVAIAASATLTDLVNSGGAYSRPSVAATTASRTTQAATPAAAHRATTAAPAIKGTPVPGNNLTEKLDWLQENVESGGNYLIELNANETISPKTLSYEGKSKITITIVGVGENRSIFLSSNGNMFEVNSDVTLVLDDNVTLQGRSQNHGLQVYVNGGALRMNAGSTITGNINRNDGGGIYVNSGTFTMNGGVIFENTASNGGGVYVGSGTFNMNDGTITGNIASNYGGGVYLSLAGATFNKSGGTITGYANDADNGNRALPNQKGSAHTVCSGHAISAGLKCKETTVGPDVKLSYNKGQRSGAWDRD